MMCVAAASAYIAPAGQAKLHDGHRASLSPLLKASTNGVASSKESADDGANELLPVPLFTKSKAQLEDESVDEQYGDEFNEARRVLLIYTGGTLGMIKLPDGSLAPERGGLARAIREMPEMRDPSMPDLDFIEYDPLIDSSNVSPADWARLARQIRDNYYDYDGFVIAHGTDTMAYTASALSFMLEGLGKAVVLTGSMIPLAEVYNDARRNLLISMVFAAQLELCEVAIFFNDRLLRGNRAVKIDSNSLAAFDSPNFPPLATVGASVVANRASWRAPPASRLRMHERLDTNLVVLRLAPGFDDTAIVAMIANAPSLKGIVLSLYGTGNGPSAKAEFLGVIQDAIDRGLLVVAATQCVSGTVNLETYEVGRRLLELGVISAGDMTTEAVVTKMAYLFGRRLSTERLRKAMNDDLRGERTVGVQSSWGELSSLGGFVGAVQDPLRVPGSLTDVREQRLRQSPY